MEVELSPGRRGTIGGSQVRTSSRNPSQTGRMRNPLETDRELATESRLPTGRRRHRKPRRPTRRGFFFRQLPARTALVLSVKLSQQLARRREMAKVRSPLLGATCEISPVARRREPSAGSIPHEVCIGDPGPV